MVPLPIDSVLGDIADNLSARNRLVLSAPPGAGKTTKVPLHLLSSEWLTHQKIILLEPRRIAARRAAERMAHMLGQRVGDTVGLRSRLDTRISKTTKIEVVTEGVFTNQIIKDPELSGIGAVIFDEYHERSLDADLGLALALESQDVLRDELRLMVMSATLDVAAIQSMLNAPVVESEGRAFPVETIYKGRTDQRLEDQMARAIRNALSSQSGSILAFLPGAGEIERTTERLSDLPDNIVVCPLYGALSPKAQDQAIKPASEGKRKIVIATDIAESSLTIEGVRVVIDAGLSRVPDYKPNALGSGLKTVKASIANVDQRRGRAGRTEPGVCYRLWHEEENRGLPKSPPPEIRNADLSSMILKLASWGNPDPKELKWLDAPLEGQVKGAIQNLKSLCFLDDNLKLTELGQKAANLPMSPRLAALVLAGTTDGEKSLAASLAAMLSEHGMGGRSCDLTERFAQFQRDTSPRTKALKDQARKWSGVSAKPDANIGDLLCRAWPDRIARQRAQGQGRYQLAGGGGAKLTDNDKLLGQDWLIIVESGGASKGDQTIRLASPITEALATRYLTPKKRDFAEYDPMTKSVRARTQKTLGEIILSETPLQKPPPVVIADAVYRAVQTDGLVVLPNSEQLLEYKKRMAFALVDLETHGLNDTQLIDAFDDWLRPVIETSGLKNVSGQKLVDALKAKLGWEMSQKIEALAPKRWTSPTGQKHAIDYDSEQAPMVSVRVQDLYGQTEHPTIGEARTPLTLSLLSPAQRQVALTKDLSGFWSGGYNDMRKDMKGRYPKHNWPEHPQNSAPKRRNTKS